MVQKNCYQEKGEKKEGKKRKGKKVFKGGGQAGVKFKFRI